MENGLNMLQKEIDSVIDCRIPLVKPKKGFLQKLTIFKKKLLDKIVIGTQKLLKSRGVKSLARLEVPAQIISVIVLGTLLGAAYAVTMQNGDNRYVAIDGTLHAEITVSPIVRKQELASFEAATNVFLEEGVSSQSKPDAIEPALSDNEQERIKNLEKQLLLVQQKSERLALSDLQLKKKLNFLLNKNRLLSDRLGRIDQLSNALKKRYGE